MIKALMGIDLGTSSLKTVVIDLDGRILALASREYRVETPRPGWAEQQPDVWLTCAIASMREALQISGLHPDQIAGIGLSGQMHGTVCLDADMGILRPAIIWADQRSKDQVAHVNREIGTANLAAWTGNPLATGFMLASWLWLREHEPDLTARTRLLLLPKDYFRYRLTGEVGTEPSDAGGSSLFDIVNRGWSTPLLQALEIEPKLLPPVGASAAIAGGLMPEIATATGLQSGTPVVYGGSDQAMQALGHGVIAPGMLSSTIGTGGQLFAPTQNPTYDGQGRLHCFCHVLPNLWHMEAAMLSAGLSLKWLRDTCFAGAAYQDLADAAGTVPAGAEGLFFLPYLAGERTPHMDPLARGAFVGLTLRHRREHMARAVMEGVVFGMRQGLDLMLDLGTSIERVVASGGAVRHPLWLQLQADIFNRPIYMPHTVEAAAVGAALLAGIGTAVYPDAAAAIRRVVRWREGEVKPDPVRVATYASLYDMFCEIYPALRSFYHTLP